MKPAQVDLSAAVAQVHERAPKPKAETEELADVSDQLLLAPGDEPDRTSFFDHQVRKGQAGVKLGHGVALPDYRTRTGKRTHRSMITVPPSLRKRIQVLAPGQPWTTALIALADFAAAQLARSNKTLVVKVAQDTDAEDRFNVRKLLRKQGLKR